MLSEVGFDGAEVLGGALGACGFGGLVVGSGVVDVFGVHGRVPGGWEGFFVVEHGVFAVFEGVGAGVAGLVSGYWVVLYGV